MSDEYLIVGLGNPGEQYKATRHNVGFEAVDLLAARLGCLINDKKFGGLLGRSDYNGKKLILLKPMQYMNNSGQVVATAAGFYKIPLQQLMIISDDMAFEPGRIRIRAQGSAGGHNGLADVVEKLGTEQFARCRIGIGQSDRADSRDYVLDKFTAQQRQLVDSACRKAVDAVCVWLDEGINAAMNGFNAVDEQPPDRPGR